MSTRCKGVDALKKDKRDFWLTVAALAALTAFVGLTQMGVLKLVDSYQIHVLNLCAIYTILGLSMNLVNGFTGLFSLGQAGFMAIGAYVTALLIMAPDVKERVFYLEPIEPWLGALQCPFWVALLVGGILAAVVAFFIGFPVLRLRGDYLAIATLGFAEIIRAIVQWDTLGPVTNGSNLLKTYPTFKTVMPGSTVLFPFIVAGICIGMILLLINSTYGRAFKAIRDDEIAAEAMGINLFHHKQMAFVISSFFAGVGGALLAMYQGSLQANAFKSSMTYEILLIVVIGGMGSISGSVLASFLFIACSEWWLRFLDNETFIGDFQIPLLGSGFRMVVFSVVIMIVVLFFRRGLMGDRELWNLRIPKKAKTREVTKA